MKAILLLSAVLAVALADDTMYTTKYDNINLDEILNNRRLLMNYYNCVQDKGSCTPDGEELKKAIPDALKTQCSKCNEKQREGTEKVIRHLIEKEPELWKELQKKHDPEGIYYKKYQTEAEKRNIKLPS